MEKIELPNKDKLIVRFDIEPVAAVRMTRGELKLKYMDERILTKAQISKKKAIAKYMNFKSSMAWLAKSQRFVMPLHSFWMIFFVPTSNEERWGYLHTETTPDTDNFAKALKDATNKNDHMIADYRATKVWAACGRIEIYTLT